MNAAKYLISAFACIIAFILGSTAASSNNPVQNNKYISEIESLNKEITELQNSLSSEKQNKNNIENLNLQINEITAELNNYRNSYIEAQNQIVDLEEEIKTLKASKNSASTSTPKKATASTTPAPSSNTTTSTAPAPKQSATNYGTKWSDYTYIANKNTKKFHYSWCNSVNDMKESNKKGYNERSSVIDAGCVPCKKCNP